MGMRVKFVVWSLLIRWGRNEHYSAWLQQDALEQGFDLLPASALGADGAIPDPPSAQLFFGDTYIGTLTRRAQTGLYKALLAIIYNTNNIVTITSAIKG